MPEFLHERRDFDQVLAVVADERGLDPMLVEKDYSLRDEPNETTVCL